ncbi:MAG: hypothetical protein ACLVB1_07615 [Blautia obeum]
MDELFGEPVKKEGKEQNPSLAKTTKSRLSEPTSKKQEKTAEGTSKLFTPENQRNHRSERNFGKYRMQGRKKRSGVRIEMIR